MARIAILGAGMMGSALAVPLVDRGHELRLIGTELDDELSGVEAVALGVSSAGVRWAGAALAPHLQAGTPLLMISKGLVWDGEHFQILPDLLKQTLPEALDVDPVAV